MCVFMYVCVCVYVYMYVRVCVCTCLYVYAHVCTCMYVYAHICTCTCMCVCVYVRPKNCYAQNSLASHTENMINKNYNCLHTQQIILTALRVILNTRSQATNSYTDQLLSCLTLGADKMIDHTTCGKLAGNITRICAELHYKGIHMLSQHSLLNHSPQQAHFLIYLIYNICI